MSYVVLFTSKLVEADEQYHTLNDALYQALVKQQGYSTKAIVMKRPWMYYMLLGKPRIIEAMERISVAFKSAGKGKQKWYEFYQVKVCKIEK